jgi:hypothetical protein
MPTTTSPARQSALTDLFTTALEGGIGYWSLASGYRWDCAWEDQGVWLLPCEPEDSDHWRECAAKFKIGTRVDEVAGEPVVALRLTPAMMGTGLGRLTKACPGRQTNCGDSFVKLSRTLGTEDQSDYDAGDADVICQFALGFFDVYVGRGEMNGRTMETYG